MAWELPKHFLVATAEPPILFNSDTLLPHTHLLPKPKNSTAVSSFGYKIIISVIRNVGNQQH